MTELGNNIKVVLGSEDLLNLKKKMPRESNVAIQNAYEKRFSKSISRMSINRFFRGESYSARIHRAILDVAEDQIELASKTREVING